MGVPGPTGSSVMSTTRADVDFVPAGEVAPLVLTTGPTAATPAAAPGLDDDDVDDDEAPEPAPPETMEAAAAVATAAATLAAFLVLSDAVLALIMVALVAPTKTWAVKNESYRRAESAESAQQTGLLSGDPVAYGSGR